MSPDAGPSQGSTAEEDPGDTDLPEEVIRMALVLNGGVSLAVWMSGVTHEVNRLLDRDEFASPAWRDILAAARERDADVGPPVDRRVVVDYVAGTSAGGLNGALLAAAIARVAPLPELKTLWLTRASLTENALLPPAGGKGESLLNGDYFEAVIKEQLQGLHSGVATGPRDMTLLTTATVLSSSRLDVEDANGHKLDVSDHRRVYCFHSGSHVGSKADGFDAPEALEVLARAARASAGFPAAFRPVDETPGLRAHRWPSPPKKVPTGSQWLIDGGVLDNAPFEPLLEEITRHARPDAGRRWVVYVVPYALGSKAETKARRKSPPTWFNVVGKLSGLKGEVDLRSDVDTLRRLQAQTRATHRRPEELLTLPPLLPMDAFPTDAPGPAEGETSPIFEIYCRTRAAGFIQYIREQGGDTALGPIKIRDADVDALLTPRAYFIPERLSPYRDDGTWQWGSVVATRLSRWISRDLRNQPDVSPATVVWAAALETQLLALAEKISQHYQQPRYAGMLPAVVVRKQQKPVGLLVAQIKPLMEQIVDLWAPTRSIDTAEAWRRLLGVEVVTNFAEWHTRPAPAPFEVLLVDTAPKDLGKYVLDMDPELLDVLGGAPSAKLYGLKLGHFAAFGHEDYRRHDWTWGRLDAVLCLARPLLAGVREQERHTLCRALVDEVLLEEMTNKSPEQARLQLRDDTWVALNLKTTRALLKDILDGGEADVAGLIESVEDALDSMTKDTLPWEAVDALAEVVSESAQAVLRVRSVAQRARNRVRAFSERVEGIIRRHWPL